MQQLDYWFERYPGGFYKFLEPSEHPKYVIGQSWSEEIGVSVAEFRTAFDRIGTRWKSKTEFENAPDKFLGKFYASYQDKRANLTFYYRNHELVDAALDELLAHLGPVSGSRGGEGAESQGVKMALITDLKPHAEQRSTGDEESQSPVDKEPSFTGANEIQPPVGVGMKSLGVQDAHLQELGNPQLNNTENTNTEIKQRLQQPQTLGQAENSGCSSFIYPLRITKAEQESLMQVIKPLDAITAQAVLDEVAGLRRSGKVRVSIIALATGLVKKSQDGVFIPAAGLPIVAERESAVKEQQVKIQRSEPTTDSKSRIPLRQRLAEAGIALKGF
ncbi:hypothetical protein Msip34_2846 (plasmid) [Methylovorus glucosotrophus SIP3-4]|uniref:Uncharacterized protein n=2 Tax=Methylovorus glucosotrophus TaxID=266009 RepID=C6XEL3_METGS|nr:hypothetical protein Msip34_2846 [Methylovorus glucosotrophus SIP3-4]